MPEQVYNYLLEKLGAAAVVESSTTEPGHPLLGALLEPFGASRVLIAMLFENDRGVGLIAVGRNTTRFTPREIELFGRIAELGSHAFANVGLLETAERASELKSEFVDRKSTRLNSSHSSISYAVFCLKKKKLSYYEDCSEKTKRS